MALTRMPVKGDKIRFRHRPLQILVVDHVDSNNLVWCVYPNGAIHPFIGLFRSDSSFNREAEIVP